MNFLELIRVHFPTATDAEADSLLWVTPFPFVDVSKIEESLTKIKAKWGDDINVAINGEMAEFDAEFKRFHEEQKKEDAIS